MHAAKIESTLKKAARLHQKQKLSDAAKLYQSVLKAEPMNVDALHYYGLLHHHRGDSKQAVEMILAAVGIKSDYFDAYLNLGNIFLGVSNFENAQKCYEKALELQPTNIGVGTNLGILHKYKGELAKSEAYLKAVLEAAPNISPSYINLAHTQFVMKKGEEALANYRQAILLSPTDASIYAAALRVCQNLKLEDQALEFINLWQEIDKDHPGLHHLRAAHSGIDVPSRASDAYIKTTFDGYADTFESSLAKLEYCGPTLLGDTLKNYYAADKYKLTILDAGCGTGLAHEYLKPYAKKLMGMDLSSKMLDKARNKKSYDQLIQSSLETGINKYHDYFDLVVSMDTLIYFGDLSAVFKNTHKALKEKGLFIFSLEKYDKETEYQLCHHGRYEHSKNYIMVTLEKFNYDLIELEERVVRKEHNEDVDGWLVVARKSLAN